MASGFSGTDPFGADQRRRGEARSQDRRSTRRSAEDGADRWRNPLDEAGRRVDAWWTEWTEQSVDARRPRVRPSLPVMGRVVADELLLRRPRRPRPNEHPVGSAELIGAESEIASATELYERRGWLADPAAFHRAPPAATPAEQPMPWSMGRATALRFESEYAPEPEDPARTRWLGQKANRAAHAWMVREERDATRWLICVPGLALGGPLATLASLDARTLQRRHGVNVLVYVPPLHGPRRAGRLNGDGAFLPRPLSYVHFAAQAVWDLRRLIAWVREQGGERIGLYGLGLGAVPTSLLGALDADLGCLIAGVPEIDGMRRVQPYCESLARQTGEAVAPAAERIERLYDVVSPLAAPLASLQTPRFVFAGLVDRFAPPEDAERLAAHWQGPELVWHQGGHVSFGRDPEVRNLLMRALWAGGLIDRERFERTRRPARSLWA